MSAPAPVTAPINAAELPASTFLQNQLKAVEPSIPEQLKFLKSVLSTIVGKVGDLEKKTHSIPTLISIYKSTGVPPITFAALIIVAGLVAIRRAIKANAALVANLVGAIYPAYRSIKAVERPQQDDDERWLTYWTIFGAFSITDQFSARILQYFPLYFTSKMAALYWLFRMNGSLVVYRKVARPLLIKYGGLNATSATSTPTTAASRSRETSYIVEQK